MALLSSRASESVMHRSQSTFNHLWLFKEMRSVGHTYFFQNMRFKGFISKIWRAVSLLGEKVNFFNSLGITGISGFFKFSVYIDIALLKIFPE